VARAKDPLQELITVIHLVDDTAHIVNEVCLSELEAEPRRFIASPAPTRIFMLKSSLGKYARH
jgi:hypothetical protein